MFAERVRDNNAAKKFKIKVLSAAAVSGILMMSLFQNCAQHDDGAGSGSLGSADCSAYMQAAFESTVHSFAVSNCAGCHTNSGVGKQAFAEGDVTVAWEQFSVISDSAAKFYNNSTSTSHAPGISGPALESAATGVRDALESAQTACLQSGGGGIAGVAVQSTNKSIELAVGSSRTIYWQLDSEMTPSPNSGGALLFIDIQATSANYYTLSRPRIRTGSEDLYVKTMKIILNGQVVDLATLFTGVDKTIPMWTNENVSAGMLSEQAVTVPIVINVSDTIAVGFDALGAGGSEEE